MTTYFEYKVNLTDNQKRSLASAMNNQTPLTLRIKHSNLSGNDELMLTKTQRLERVKKRPGIVVGKKKVHSTRSQSLEAFCK